MPFACSAGEHACFLVKLNRTESTILAVGKNRACSTIAPYNWLSQWLALLELRLRSMGWSLLLILGWRNRSLRLTLPRWLGGLGEVHLKTVIFLHLVQRMTWLDSILLYIAVHASVTVKVLVRTLPESLATLLADYIDTTLVIAVVHVNL